MAVVVNLFTFKVDNITIAFGQKPQLNDKREIKWNQFTDKKIIMMIGAVGVGKSRFINKFSKSVDPDTSVQASESDIYNKSTNTISIFTVGDYLLIDTKGIDDIDGGIQIATLREVIKKTFKKLNHICFVNELSKVGEREVKKLGRIREEFKEVPTSLIFTKIPYKLSAFHEYLIGLGAITAFHETYIDENNITDYINRSLEVPRQIFTIPLPNGSPFKVPLNAFMWYDPVVDNLQIKLNNDEQELFVKQKTTMFNFIKLMCGKPIEIN